MKLHLIAGARPNFMKIAPLWHALRGHRTIKPVFVHTAQHHEDAMSSQIWRALLLPEPDHVLPRTSGTDVDPISTMMTHYERLCKDENPGAVLVVGDVNSSLAAARVAARTAVPLIHLEAGLRCFDPTLPEERNRVEIDQVSDLLLTPSADADENLLSEGVAPDRIRRVGNVMIDTFEMMRPQIMQENAANKLGVRTGDFILVTLHRPTNVDDPEMLQRICDALVVLATHKQVCFAIHPRTQNRLRGLGLDETLRSNGVQLLPAPGYVSFASLMMDAGLVITDSGGVQEETSYLGIPCLTLRTSTERPITVTHGTNQLVDVDPLVDLAVAELDKTSGRVLTPSLPNKIPLWDGRTASRTVAALEAFLC